MDPQNRLIDLLSCARLRRYSNYVWQTSKLRIGIPISPETDAYTLAADLVLRILQKKLPRKLMRSYLMQIISYDEVAAILRDWRGSKGENIMHLAVAQYDIDFVELLAAKCGEDLLTTESNSSSNLLPLCCVTWRNLMITQNSRIHSTIDYYIKKVPNGLSWMRSGVFYYLASSEGRIRANKFMRALFDRPIVVSDITEHEKIAVKTFFCGRGSFSNLYVPDRQHKFSLLFLLSEPSKFECTKSSVIPDRCGTFWEPKRIQDMLNLCEEVKNMKGLTAADKGMLLAQAQMLFDSINNNAPELPANRPNRQERYIRVLRILNDVGALPTTPEEAINAKEDETDPLLVLLAQQPILHRILKFQSLKNDLPSIYVDFINIYLQSWFRGPVFRSPLEISSVIEFPLLDLPFDILTTISCFLPYRDLIAFSLTNKQLERLRQTTRIGSAKFEQYFPNDVPAKVYSQNSFNWRYKNKFAVKEIAGRGMYTSTEFSVPLYCDKWSVELHQHEFLYSSKHFNTLSLLDMNTKQLVSVQNYAPVVARVHQDRVITMRQNLVEVRNKSALEVISEFPRSDNFPFTKLPYFALSNNWLISPDRFYDWTTGQTLNSWPQHQQVIVARHQMCYGISGGDILIRDLRQAGQIQQKVSNANVDKFTSMNVLDGKIYTAGQSIDIFDTRYLQKPLSSAMSRSIGPCDKKDKYAIDLVNMNVWGSQISWDLIDNKWEHADICSYHNISDKLCNGKYLAVLFLGVLLVYELPGSSTPFPYGDLNIHRPYYDEFA